MLFHFLHSWNMLMWRKGRQTISIYLYLYILLIKMMPVKQSRMMPVKHSKAKQNEMHENCQSVSDRSKQSERASFEDKLLAGSWRRAEITAFLGLQFLLGMLSTHTNFFPPSLCGSNTYTKKKKCNTSSGLRNKSSLREVQVHIHNIYRNKIHIVQCKGLATGKRLGCHIRRACGIYQRALLLILWFPVFTKAMYHQTTEVKLFFFFLCGSLNGDKASQQSSQ